MGLYWIQFKFGFFLAQLSKLPWGFITTLIRIESRWTYQLNLDWRTILHKDVNLKKRCLWTYKRLLKGEDSPEQLVRDRYFYQSREELIAQLFIRRKCSFRHNLNSSQITGRLEPDRGVIYATVHWGESTLASALLADLGKHVQIMASKFVISDSVPLPFRRYYESKYQAMDCAIGRTQTRYIESGLLGFHRHLKRGGAVAMTIDIPQSEFSASREDFFGEDASFLPGFRYLQKTLNCAVIPYVAYYDYSKGWMFEFADSDEAPYGFFERIIREDPARWWGADLLPLAYGVEV